MTARQDGAEPLEDMDETLPWDGGQWMMDAPGGKAWVIRWFSRSGNVAAWRFPRGGRTHRGHAVDLAAARREVLRIAAVIDGRET